MSQGPELIGDGMVMGESPRWRDGRVWVSDFGAGELVAYDAAGGGRVAAEPVPGSPMGTGFLADGRLLVVSLQGRDLLVRAPDGALTRHADLGRLSDAPWSDLVVDGRDNAYVGCIGFDFPQGEFAPGSIALVRPDGSAELVAGDLMFPNGMAVTPDGSTLIVAESYASRLTAFTVDDAGRLSDRRVWADLPGSAPDGICLDADGAVWFAEVPGRRCVRVRVGGEILEERSFDRGCFACALGGPDGRTLYVTAAEFPPTAWGPDAERTGRLLAVPAPAPAAGWR